MVALQKHILKNLIINVELFSSFEKNVYGKKKLDDSEKRY